MAVYWEGENCFEPHLIHIVQSQTLHPFVTLNQLGPCTNLAIPIFEHPYYLYADSDLHHNIHRAKRTILVDTQTMQPTMESTATNVAHTSVFTVLTPCNALKELILPGLLWPTQFGPLDFPHVRAKTLGDRCDQLFSNC